MVERRLAAILAADVVGYSNLVSIDEAGTLSKLRALQMEVIEPQIAKFSGRLFKTMGDGFLVEFVSAVQAVSCAKAIQEANTIDQMVLRIGIHLGDVVVQGDDLLGDGVNIAARIEGIAAGGGIAISRQVHDQVQDKLDIAFVDKGDVALKNLARPVHVFAMSGAGAAGKHLLPLDKPSIAVLPFQNMSGDPEQEYFADGMVEDITTALSRNKRLFVIARNSSFTYKGRATDVRQVGRELGVRYVLEGSVRRSGGRLRLTGQLVDATNGIHVWADRFDGALDDIFDLQDRITSGVVVAMLPILEQAEIERSRHKPTESLAAYDYYLRGRALYAKHIQEANDPAIVQFRKAAELDPDWGLPVAHIGECIKRRIEWGWSTDTKRDAAEAAVLAHKAMAIENADPQAMALAGSALMLTEPEEAAGLLDRAIALDSNYFSAWNWRGWTALVIGEKDAGRYFEKALRLSPSFPGRYWLNVGLSATYIVSGRYDEAVSLLTSVLRQHSEQHLALVLHTVALALAGKADEALRSRENLMKAAPALRLSNIGTWLMTRDAETLRIIRNGLQLAGVAE